MSTSASITFHFVGGTAAGEYRRGRRTRADRSHVARINRQRRKTAAADVVAAVLKAKQSGSERSEKDVFDSSSSQCSSSEDFTNGLQHRDSLLALQRPSTSPVGLGLSISPVLGATPVNTFPLQDAAINAARIQKYFQIIDQGALRPRDRATWFATFCQSVLVHHCVSYVVDAFQDMITAVPMRPETLMHRGEVIRTANSLLANERLIAAQAEPLLLAVATLFAANTKNGASPMPPAASLFRPYIPYDAAVATMDEDGLHVKALAWLIERTGGLNRLERIPNFGKVMAYTFAIYASAHARPPAMSLCADSMLVKPLEESLLCPPERFCRAVPLPTPALGVLDAIKTLDARFGGRQHDIFLLRGVLSHVQLRLLSLPDWSSLSEEEHLECPEAVYETTRISAIIYSNAVLMAPAFSCPWVDKHLSDLKRTMETSNGTDFSSSWGRNLLSWSLYIATITAWHTPFRPYFSVKLEKHLAAERLLSWSDLRSILQKFLWSDIACSEGATVVWQAIQGDR